MNTAELIKLFLILSMMAMALLALNYLRRRQIAWQYYVLWGLLAILLPFLGPFIVIACRPGVSRYAIQRRGISFKGQT